MEQEPQKIHFRMGGKITHCGVEILPNGKDIEYIVIDHIEWRETEVVNGEKTPCFVAIFAQNPYTRLPMVLNMENKTRLLKLTRVSEYDLLTIKNLPVRLTAENTRLNRLGLRISKLPPVVPTQRPPEKQTLTPEHPDWAKCVQYVKDGNNVDGLLVRFNITEEVKTQIITEATANGTEGV